jgi:type IV pilus assembly protein PilM
MAISVKKAFVGVDIGHSKIKVVQVETANGGYRVTKVGSASTPPDSVRDGQINNADEIGVAIRSAMKDAHISAGHAVVAAAGGAVFVRTVPFPKMTAQMLRDSVKYEAARYVPGSVEDSYVEAEISGPLSDTQMNVLLAAAPRDVVQGRIDACEKAGLSVSIVEIETFSTYRALLEFDPTREVNEKTYMIVDIGAANTGVTVVDKGAFVMHRSMPTAGNAFTEALRQAFKLEAVDAEAGKTVLDMHELLSPGAQENPPLKVIQTQVDDLIRELRRSMNYLQTQSQQAEQSAGSIDAIILSGGGAMLKGLGAYIQNKLGVPVHSVGVFDNSLILQSGQFEGSGHDLAVATGLAIRAHLKAA